VDIGRTSCQSVATVLKVYPNINDGFKISLVNICILGKTIDEKRFEK